MKTPSSDSNKKNIDTPKYKKPGICQICGILVLFIAVALGVWYWYVRLPGKNGLGYTTTAEEAVRPGVNLEGKNIIITGGYSGIGVATVETLAKLKAKIWLPARPSSMDKCEKVAKSIGRSTGNPHIFCEEMDLSSFHSVKQFATNWKKKNLPLHILILNAGVGSTPVKKTEDGFENIWQSNHLGHFLLTHLLMDNLKSGSPCRVVVVSSDAHQYSDIKWDDISGEGTWYTDTDHAHFVAYGQSKTANILFAKKLNELLKGYGVANSLHPGAIVTGIFRNIEEGIFKEVLMGLIALLGKTVEQGAATQIYVATAPELATVGGHYFQNCDIATTEPYADDAEAADRLWQISLDSVEKWLD